jgi:alkanesulfonate monooxygenase SsuD/methylene tetrahydromethanopterin reductase-like flavin-dependent oxidoreductase (luciferase family)
MTAANSDLVVAPYILARTWATLDHVTKGRVAWNVVTSFNTTAAQAMGYDDVKSSLERYEAAHEYMDLCYQFVPLHRERGLILTDII